MNKARNRDFTPQNIKRLISRGRRVHVFKTVFYGGCKISYIPFEPFCEGAYWKKRMNDVLNNDGC
jgi:hypothetical protein